jgi:hypothetical protein
MALTLQANKKTTISGAFAAGATSLTLASAAFTNFTDGYLVLEYDVDSKFEIIKCSVTGTAVTSITRGEDGTSDVDHASGAKIGFAFIPSHYSRVAVRTLGYAAVTANQTAITTEVDLTSLTIAVTVPAGARIRITGFTEVSNDGVGGRTTMYIKEGATYLQRASIQNAIASSLAHINCQVTLTPSAGAHTYKLSMEANSGNTNTAVAATNPAFILVENIE